MNIAEKIDYDIVIVGGGLVGSSLACALADTSLSILVVESAAAQPEPSSEYDIRVSAITSASRNFFQSIGVWQAMRDRRMGEVREMKILDAEGSGSLHLDSADIAESSLAHIIENSVIRRALFDRLQTLANVRYLDNSRIEQVGSEEQFIQLLLNGTESITTRLVVGADGARSAVRDWAEIPVSGWPFDQTAIVATVKTELAHQSVAYQRFLSTGPLAFLPLDDPNTSSIVWSADTELAKQLIALPENEFIKKLEVAFDNQLGDVIEISERASFPLALMHAEHTVHHRLVLVGDAAHRVHPLAGQGLNLGLADVAALAEVLLNADQDAGSSRLLRRYERWRAGDTRFMVALMDVFKRLFGDRQPIVQGVRNFGMDLIDSNKLLKQLLVLFASGTTGDVPALLKQDRS